jgi:hypothetical protein
MSNLPINGNGEKRMNAAIFGFIGVLLGSTLPLISQWLSERVQRTRHARYLAIRVICVLEQFINECSHVVNDDGLRMGQRDKYDCLHEQVDNPAPPVYPSDVDWKSIDHATMFDLLAFPNKVEAGRQAVFFMRDFADPPDYEEYYDERQLRYSELGLKAGAIVSHIKATYRIGDVTEFTERTAGFLTKIEEVKKRQVRSHVTPPF